jgi:hypothetical protein
MAALAMVAAAGLAYRERHRETRRLSELGPTRVLFWKLCSWARHGQIDAKGDEMGCRMVTKGVWVLAHIALLATGAFGGDTAGAILGANYPTPQDCPRFANPEFLSRPLEKAYPGIEYNIRPGVRGGTYPYTFTLDKSPAGMKIDAANGTVRWTPQQEGAFDISIRATDSAGKSATQSYKLTVTKGGFYFASPDGNDANPGTIEKPWKTVMRVAKPPEDFTYPAGAVVYLRGGGYGVDVPAAAGKTNANVIRLDARSPSYWLAYPAEKPVIDFGWSGEKQKAVLDEQKAAGSEYSNTQGYGHRFSLAPGYFYFDGFEVKNACYYMFVMWNGENTVHFRRCDMHHLWCDYAENPGFIFTFSGDREGGKEWGVRAKVKAYRNFVIQDNRFHDRFMIGSHGAAFTWYTVHDAIIEDNVFERVGKGGNDGCFWDKDNGLGNTYRGNVVRGDCGILSQGSCDEIEFSHNYIEGQLRIWGHAGWCRNIWVHHNTIRGQITFPWLSLRVPEKLDEKAGDFSSPTTEDSVKAVREYPIEKRFVHVYRNVIEAVAGGDPPFPNVVAFVSPLDKRAAEDLRCIRWDDNLIDSKGQVWVAAKNRPVLLDYTFWRSFGFDAKGLQVPVTLDKDGNLPSDSPYLGKYGRQLAPGK